MAEDRDCLCRCGATGWTISGRAPGTHVECYCADCQSFARHLGATDWLDGNGGTEVFQTVPRMVTVTRGAGNLRTLRLGPKGLVRWYAGCCGTPVANTLARGGLPFVGMILRPGQQGFGPVACHANTGSARGPVRAGGLLRAGAAILWRALAGRLSGRHLPNTFFDAAGVPAVTPRILTAAERAAARPAARPSP